MLETEKKALATARGSPLVDKVRECLVKGEYEAAEKYIKVAEKAGHAKKAWHLYARHFERLYMEGAQVSQGRCTFRGVVAGYRNLAEYDGRIGNFHLANFFFMTGYRDTALEMFLGLWKEGDQTTMLSKMVKDRLTDILVN